MAGAVNFEMVREMALSLPGVEEGTSYGTPAFRVRGKFLARLHEDGASLVLKMDFDTRDFVLRALPRAFHLTDHYRGYPYVLVRLGAVEPEDLRAHLEQAWRQCAPKRQVADYDSNLPGSRQ